MAKQHQPMPRPCGAHVGAGSGSDQVARHGSRLDRQEGGAAKILDWLSDDSKASAVLDVAQRAQRVQRLRLATQIRSNLFGVVYVLDADCGASSRRREGLVRRAGQTQERGNLLFVVEHDPRSDAPRRLDRRCRSGSRRRWRPHPLQRASCRPGRDRHLSYCPISFRAGRRAAADASLAARLARTRRDFEKQPRGSRRTDPARHPDSRDRCVWVRQVQLRESGVGGACLQTLSPDISPL